jgi:hypothetical protein
LRKGLLSLIMSTMKARIYILFASILASTVFFLTLNRAASNTPGTQVLGERGRASARVEINYQGESRYLMSPDLVGKTALEAREITANQNDFEIDLNKEGWVYFVNGETMSAPADQYLVKPGDKLEWEWRED